MRPGNWYALLYFTTVGSPVLDMSRVEVGGITATNQVVGYGEARDPSTISRQYYARLFSNDGDDTFTERFLGSVENNLSVERIGFRCQNGCIGVFDEDDNTWDYWEGRNAVGVAYTPANAFIQVRKITGSTLNIIHLTRIQIVYTL
jgi:hypothetical protein